MAVSPTMVAALAVLLVLSLATQASAQASGLRVGFYNRKCGKTNVEGLVASLVASAQKSDPTICAALIRLHFHDCFVDGCDGSILLDFPADPAQSEKNSPPNANSVRGYEVIDTIKAALEARCPSVVSCTDIAALTARDCVRLLRGLNYRLPTGRLDGTTSGGRLGPLQQLPAPFHDINTIVTLFSRWNLDKTDVVLLSGLHTVGRARCLTFSNRLFDAAGNPIQDPFLTPERSAQLRLQCPFGGDAQKLVDMDATPRTVDTSYFKQVVGNTAVFQSDHNLLNDNTTAGIVTKLAGPPKSRPRPVVGLGPSLVKMGNAGVLTGTNGQVRKVCNAVNAA